ncbi:hypothetical protein [Streptoalloteichus hindustanus]|uniref:Uncharacterized protein n=1 Tax=Streptoalloteichus hindustanus TaxID=2017 RepID=A0A1M5BQ84_STRHI|nr:hypothetical protein [Streptoalloteichus hindustanus]SHF44412.1 hypothetical protein SAMN05444320_103669 [Streptoalloteichus hindustanus]
MDIEQHPDLRDERWQRAATRRAHRDARRLRRRARFRRHLPKTIAILSAVALAGGLALHQSGRLDSLLADSAPSTSTAHTSTTAPSTVEAMRKVDLARPFAGTPAEGWADGTAGFVAPPPAPVAGYSPEQVAEATEKVRRFLTAARLDRQVLENHTPDPVLAQLDPESLTTIRAKLAGGDVAGTSWILTRVSKGQRLLPVEPKVNGRMWVESGEHGTLAVHTNYVIAYAFDPGDKKPIGPMDIVALERWEATYLVGNDIKGLWPGKAQGFTYSIACGEAKKGFLAPSISERRLDGKPAKHDSAYYFDPANPMGDENACGN